MSESGYILAMSNSHKSMPCKARLENTETVVKEALAMVSNMALVDVHHDVAGQMEMVLANSVSSYLKPVKSTTCHLIIDEPPRLPMMFSCVHFWTFGESH